MIAVTIVCDKWGNLGLFSAMSEVSTACSWVAGATALSGTSPCGQLNTISAGSSGFAKP